MSLLMDALRKAEQQKQAGVAQAVSGQGEVARPLALEPHATDRAGAGTSRLPELPGSLEELDEQFIVSAARTPKPKRPATAPPAEPGAAALNTSADASRAAARALFETKHPAPKENHSFAIAVGLLTLVAAVSIGGYFWWQLQPKSSLVAGGNGALSHTASAAPTAPTAPAAPTLPAAVPEKTDPGVVSQASAVASPVNTAPNDLSPKPGRDTTRLAQPPAAPPSAASQPNHPIRVTAAPQKLNPALEQAFQAFQRGDINLAQAAWQKVLESDPRNTDALYGMAAIAQQRHQPNQAADFYLRALEVNPRDALALSGLVSLKGHVDPQQTESRLKNLLAEQVDSPFLNFALGNLYARGARWAEAQQAFFKAHVADPGNPDYLFNLAVSLDQLHQSRLAAQYYHQALGAAAQRPAGFDAVQVAVRLKVLQSGP